MSKTRLRKEIAGFTKEQLEEVVLAAYDSSADAKAYFEFFLNPDSDVFVEAQLEAIAKEVQRTRRGRISKGRISVVKAHIKKAVAYGIDPTHVASLMFGAVNVLTANLIALYYPPTLLRGILGLVADTVRYCDAHDMAQRCLDYFAALVADPKRCAREITAPIRDTVATTTATLLTGKK